MALKGKLKLSLNVGYESWSINAYYQVMRVDDTLSRAVHGSDQIGFWGKPKLNLYESG